MKSLFILFFTASTFLSNAQDTFVNFKPCTVCARFVLDTVLNGQVLMSGRAFNEYKHKRYKGYEPLKYLGTPYYANGWYPGTIIMENNSLVTGYISYNTCINRILFKYAPEKDAIELTPKAFTIAGKTFTNFRKELKRAGYDYYEVISNGNETVYKLHKKRYFETEPVLNFTLNQEIYNQIEGVFKEENEFSINKNGRLIKIQKPESL